MEQLAGKSGLLRKIPGALQKFLGTVVSAISKVVGSPPSKKVSELTGKVMKEMRSSGFLHWWQEM